tara:strand:+ start:443 stop:889 length:447 start_codon:yes stop_codon:yes gene_type:complete
MTDREVMQQALEALESGLAFDTNSDVLQNLRTALAMHQVSEFAQAQEQPSCVGKDPRCPCQDGAACHYKDCGNTQARPHPPQQQAEPMTEVADRFAHRMALELECVLSDGAYSNKWYKSAMQVLGEYRSAMNAIHEQHSPTFMGEPRV